MTTSEREDGDVVLHLLRSNDVREGEVLFSDPFPRPQPGNQAPPWILPPNGPAADAAAAEAGFKRLKPRQPLSCPSRIFRATR